MCIIFGFCDDNVKLRYIFTYGIYLKKSSITDEQFFFYTCTCKHHLILAPLYLFISKTYVTRTSITSHNICSNNRCIKISTKGTPLTRRSHNPVTNSLQITTPISSFDHKKYCKMVHLSSNNTSSFWRIYLLKVGFICTHFETGPKGARRIQCVSCNVNQVRTLPK